MSDYEATTAKAKEVLPQDGQRALIVGMTGSGKTSLGLWVLQHLPVPPVIYDTKIEPKFLALKKSVLVSSPEELHERYHDNVIEVDGIEETIADYFVVRPSADELRDPEFMDDRWLNYHYEHLHGVPDFIDEVVQWHKNGRPGVGLTNLLTRGRSRAIATIMCSQRPRHISLFCLSECDRYFMMQLQMEDDRKRLAEVMRGVDYRDEVPKHFFRYYDHNLASSVLYRPIKLADSLNTGYTDRGNAQRIEGQQHEINQPIEPLSPDDDIIFL